MQRSLVGSEMCIRDSPIAIGVIRTARWLPVVKFVTPAIFVAIFVFLFGALILR